MARKGVVVKSLEVQKATESPRNWLLNQGVEGLLISGMHRSGTSMVAGLVHRLGVKQLGKNPVGPTADNRGGSWEDSSLVRLSDDLLAALGDAWDTPSRKISVIGQKNSDSESLIKEARNEIFQLRQDVAGAWFIKDPRMSLLLDEWRRILLLGVPVIAVVRNPHDVAASLMKRDLISLRRSLALWFRYNQRLFHSLETDNNLVVDYDSLCKKPAKAQIELGGFLERSLICADGESFKVADQFLFNPRKSSMSNDSAKRQLSQELKDCFDFYDVLRSSHLSSKGINIADFVEPTWVEGELDLAAREHADRKVIAKLDERVGSLSDQLRAVEDLVVERDGELLRVRVEGDEVRTKLMAQLVEVEAKADFLFDLVAERDGELLRVRVESDEARAELAAQLVDVKANAKRDVDSAWVLLAEYGLELERMRMEGETERANLLAQLHDVQSRANDQRDQLGAHQADCINLSVQLVEAEEKSEYLFTELGLAQGELKKRDLQLNELQRLLRAADLESTRLAIAHVAKESQLSEWQKTKFENVLLGDMILNFHEDLYRLTSKRRYRLVRVFKLAMHKVVFRGTRRVSLAEDVIPLKMSGDSYMSEILSLGISSKQYLEKFPDVADQGINPFSHLITRGVKEGRALPIQSSRQ